MARKKKVPYPVKGMSVNGKSRVTSIRLNHPAYEEAEKRAKRKGFNDVGSYLRHLLEAFLLGEAGIRSDSTPQT